MNLDFEKEYRSEYGTLICGIDEAGRGPLCGPVCAAAVILKENAVIDGLNDSKKLSEKKREELFDVIKDNSVSYGIAFATPQEIDELNILNATFLAMKRAVLMCKPSPVFALVDGNRIKGLDIPAECVVKGDSKSPSIAAASVLAKVTRDRYMCELDQDYPQYNLSSHKGYPTKMHYELIKKYGIRDFYRKSFLKNLSEK
ncbi:MAG: ribonuclease HII [Clostridiales bacterium]|nr:MAG: ribonuclease HII [Clostridiales bacterium]